MTEAQVRAMVARYEAGEDAGRLGAEYGLAAGNVRAWARRVREGQEPLMPPHGGARPHPPGWSAALLRAFAADQAAGLTARQSAARRAYSVRTVYRYRQRARLHEEDSGGRRNR